MYIHDLNPVLISFGFFEIRWYSLAYIFGILIGWWIAKKIIDFKVQNKSIDLDSKTFDDLISYIIFSIIIGGALGNFCDRLVYKAVPDFIDFHFENFHWFTFNVADIFISMGIIFFLIRSFFIKEMK